MAASGQPWDVRRHRASWIVCLRTTRDVDDQGIVQCPFAGIVAMQACAECRFLEDLEADRRLTPCTTEET
jgi:hypothetical protein